MDHLFKGFPFFMSVNYNFLNFDLNKDFQLSDYNK